MRPQYFGKVPRMAPAVVVSAPAVVAPTATGGGGMAGTSRVLSAAASFPSVAQQGSFMAQRSAHDFYPTSVKAALVPNLVY